MSSQARVPILQRRGVPLPLGGCLQQLRACSAQCALRGAILSSLSDKQSCLCMSVSAHRVGMRMGHSSRFMGVREYKLHSSAVNAHTWQRGVLESAETTTPARAWSNVHNDNGRPRCEDRHRDPRVSSTGRDRAMRRGSRTAIRHGACASPLGRTCNLHARARARCASRRARPSSLRAPSPTQLRPDCAGDSRRRRRPPPPPPRQPPRLSRSTVIG